MLELLLLLSTVSSLQTGENNVTAAVQGVQQQVENNTGRIDTTTAGLGVTGAGIVGTYLTHYLNGRKISAMGSEIDKLLLNDIIDNYNDFRQSLNIDKMIIDQAQLNPTKSYAEILNMIYDVSTKETLGQKKAKFILKINEYYESYYHAPVQADFTNMRNPLKNALDVVKDKTTSS